MARGSRSFVKQTCGPMKTPSSSVTPWYRLLLFWTFTRSPTTTPTSTYTFLPMTQSAPMRAPSRT